jgi:hypothetical protein
MTTLVDLTGEMCASRRVRRWVRPIALVVYVALLHFTYTLFVDPHYGSTMDYRSPVWWSYALLVAGVVGLGLLLPASISKPSDAVLWLHFLLATAPTVLIPQITPFLPRGLAFRFALAVEVAWLGVLLMMRWGSRWKPQVPVAFIHLRGRVSARLWLTGLLTISLVAALITLLLPGVGHRVVSFANVADVRLQYRQALATVPFFVPYVLLSAAYVTNPALIAYGWMRRRWWLILIGAAGQVLNYSVTGYRTVAVSLLAVLCLAWLLGRVDRIGGTAALLTVVSGMAVALGGFLVAGVSAPVIYFTTRTMVVPGNVAAGHVAVFSKVDPLYWSQAFMSRFVHYPYSEPPSFIVGYFLSGNHDTNANVNLFGDGYESARYAGIALECLLLVILLLLLDLVSTHVTRRLVLPIILLPAFLLTNPNVFTALLTRGFALCVLVLFFAPERTDTKPQAGPPVEATR